MKLRSFKKRSIIIEVSRKEWLVISESLGICADDCCDDGEGERVYLRLMKKWDALWDRKQRAEKELK